MGFNKALEGLHGAVSNAGRGKGAGFALINGNPLGVARAIVAEMHPALGFVDDLAGAYEGARDTMMSTTAGQQAIGAIEGMQSTIGAAGLFQPGLAPIAATMAPGIMAAKEVERVKRQHPEYREQDIADSRRYVGNMPSAGSMSIADQLEANRKKGITAAPY